MASGGRGNEGHAGRLTSWARGAQWLHKGGRGLTAKDRLSSQATRRLWEAGATEETRAGPAHSEAGGSTV